MRDGTFRLTEWTGGSEAPRAGWQSVFPIYAGSSTTAMLGTYAVENGVLVFRPRFPLDPATNYHGTFPNGGFAFDIGPRPQAAARVEHVHVEQIFPSADVLPANTLRLYIYFSGPIETGDVLQDIRLLDDNGNLVSDAFLDQELWDADHRRLTVLFDPGRIKRGLAPAREAGSPIVEGRRYTLVVDAGQHFEKHFIGGPAIRTAADPAAWRIRAPRAGTTEPLVVVFSRPMDYALLQRTLSVTGVPGQIAVAASETEWRLTPDSPWRAGDYGLAVDRELEDICGNRPGRPFDVDLRAGSSPQRQERPITIPFRVRR